MTVKPVTYAILKNGGHQHKAAPGEVLVLEKLDAQVGDTVSFDEVLAVKTGSEMVVGDPYVKKAKVTGTVVQQGRGKKLRIFKFKAKKNYKRQYGHRQSFTAVRIDEIKA